MKPSKRNEKKAPFTVVDDWPEEVPVTEEEIALYETFLSDILHAMMDMARDGMEDVA